MGSKSISLEKEPIKEKKQTEPPKNNHNPKSSNGCRTPGLYIVSTPIGNAQDISLRALKVLTEVTAVICEDTRVAKKLFKIHGIANKLLSYHEYNATRARPKIIKRLLENQTLALISDAGSPLISDPGYKLITSCIHHQIPFTVVPGASALLTALLISGQPVDKFFFHGFLPRKSNNRRRALESLIAVPGSLVFFETGYRLCETLTDMDKILGNREVAIARELTKRFEEVKRGRLSDISQFYAVNTTPKGELTLVVSPKVEKTKLDEKSLEMHIAKALEKHSTKDTVNLISKKTGASKREVYKRAIEIKGLSD